MPAIDQKRLAEAIRLHEAGQLDQAERLYQALLAKAPRHPDLLHLYGVLLAQQGDGAAGIAMISQAIRLRPDATEYLENLAAAYHATGDADTAATIMRDAGSKYLASGQYAQAIAAYAEGLELRPHDAGMLANTGVAHTRLHQPGEAMTWFMRALEADPDYAPAITNRGNLLWAEARYDEALADYRRAVELDPADYAAQHNLGFALSAMGRPDEALACYDKALALRPGSAMVHCDRALVLLVKGRLQEGFSELEWRWAADYQYKEPRRPYRQPVWRGGDVKGKLLVFPEQGFGDAITLSRFVPQLAARGHDVLLETHPALERLFQQSFAGNPRVEIIPADPRKPPAFAAYVGMFSLPDRLATTRDTLSGQPFLCVEDKLADQWKAALGRLKDFRVGIIWAGDPRTEDRAFLTDSRRSLALEQFESFLDIPGLAIVSLQKGSPAAQLQTSHLRQSVCDPMPDVTDFADTAAIMRNLDLVISVDTSAANLAGALGVPVWVLAQHDVEWRWPGGGALTPWYASARIFRQKHFCQWAPVLAEIRQALEQAVSSAAGC